MPAEIVKLRDSPSLADIPGLLRKLAVDIEAGAYGNVRTAFMILPQDGGAWPKIFGWGDIDGERAPIAQLELAKIWLALNSVHRL